MSDAATPSVQVVLNISCQNLKNMDLTSRSDPVVVVSLKTPSTTWAEIGRTEHLKNNLNPKFVTPIKVSYRFETIQTLQFSVYDIDHAEKSFDDQDFIGGATTELGTIICDKAGCFKAELRHPKHQHAMGTIVVAAEESRGCSDEVVINFSAKGLTKKDLFGKSDGYVVINQQRDASQPPVPVAKTEVVMNSLDPKWAPLKSSVQTLCNGDWDRPLLLEVWDWDRSSDHDLIGSCRTTLRELLRDTPARPSFVLIDEKLRAKGKKGESGVLFVDAAQLIRNPTFMDYLRGGLEISLIAAIDFTASNGQPTDPASNHYPSSQWAGAQHTLYSKALAAVGSVLLQYDRDGNIPVYGFGARIPPTDQVSHCFPLNGNPNNPEVAGIPGLLQAYFETLQKVKLYGPTLFTPIIQAASAIASMNPSAAAAPATKPQQQKYFIMVICTDGCVDDMQATINSIVSAANSLPLSVVVVGVGNADFSKMNTLDADKGALRSSTGQVACRDIVQFVPFKKYESNPYALAEETLAEIPQQVVSFFKSRQIMPLPAPTFAPPPTH